LPEESLHNDAELLQRIHAGEQKAFEQLYESLYPRLVLFAGRYHSTAENAEEIINEAFVKFWLTKNNFTAISSIKSFLYTVTRNALLNQQRQEKTHRTSELVDEARENIAEAERNILYAEVTGILFDEINRLPAKCKEVVLLTYKDGLSSSEIADKMGISVSNVTSQRSRAIQLLKIALKDKYPLLALPLAQLLQKIY
jgi:RNA polymerase sigma-70 factor (family 1)